MTHKSLLLPAISSISKNKNKGGKIQAEESPLSLRNEEGMGGQNGCDKGERVCVGAEESGVTGITRTPG